MSGRRSRCCPAAMVFGDRTAYGPAEFLRAWVRQPGFRLLK
ncbi:DUF6368 family protein [Streptomyces sp. NPDC091209]